MPGSPRQTASPRKSPHRGWFVVTKGRTKSRSSACSSPSGLLTLNVRRVTERFSSESGAVRRGGGRVAGAGCGSPARDAREHVVPA